MTQDGGRSGVVARRLRRRNTAWQHGSDGHIDFFGEELTCEYQGIRHLAPSFEEGPDRYGVNWTLTVPTAPISQALPMSPAWRRVHEDGTAVIYARTTAR